MDNDKNYYEQYVSELNRLYKKNPEYAMKKLKRSLIRLNMLGEEKLDNKQFDIIAMVILSILIFCTGFLSLDSMYFFGFIFFIAGLFVGMYVPGFGIIFLFSHCLIGLVIMIQDNYQKILSMPIMTDNPTNINIYLGVSISFLLVAFITTILQNLIPSIKNIPHIKPLILLLFLLGILMFKTFNFFSKYLI